MAMDALNAAVADLQTAANAAVAAIQADAALVTQLHVELADGEAGAVAAVQAVTAQLNGAAPVAAVAADPAS